MQNSKQTPLALRIRAARLALGLTQEQAAKQCGIEEQVYNRIEQGRSNGSIDTIPAIATGLGLPLDELLELRKAFLERSA